MKVLGYGWHALLNLINVIAVTFILSRLQGRAEHLVVSLLIYVWLQMREYAIASSYQAWISTGLITAQIDQIKQMLAKEAVQEIDDLLTEFKTPGEFKKHIMYMDSLTDSLLIIATLWSTFSALNGSE